MANKHVFEELRVRAIRWRRFRIDPRIFHDRFARKEFAKNRNFSETFSREKFQNCFNVFGPPVKNDPKPSVDRSKTLESQCPIPNRWKRTVRNERGKRTFENEHAIPCNTPRTARLKTIAWKQTFENKRLKSRVWKQTSENKRLKTNALEVSFGCVH